MSGPKLGHPLSARKKGRYGDFRCCMDPLLSLGSTRKSTTRHLGKRRGLSGLSLPARCIQSTLFTCTFLPYAWQKWSLST